MNSHHANIVNLHSTQSSTNQICVLYRPPDGGTLDFSEDLTSYYEKEVSDRSEHILIGSFNIQMNNLTEADTINFADFMGIVQPFQLGTIPNTYIRKYPGS